MFFKRDLVTKLAHQPAQLQQTDVKFLSSHQIKLGQLSKSASNQLCLSVQETATNIATTVQLVQEINGVSTVFHEKSAQCEFSFSVSRDHSTNQTTVVGHVGKNAAMFFTDPSKFVNNVVKSNLHFRYWISDYGLIAGKCS